MVTEWKLVKRELPPIGKNVIIQALSGYYEVRYLEEVKGVMSGSGKPTTRLSWYPGGLPIGNSYRWAYIEE